MDRPVPLHVTAQQVEDGSVSLSDFALASADRHIAVLSEVVTLEGASYIQCRIREEGSPWRSGSTHLVFVTPDGRVFERAKAMALSGRLLKPEIYSAVRAAATTGNGDSFDVPTIPGASGYSVPYAPNPQLPMVMIAGSDVDESHLADEELDYGDPAGTAADVVDRETLKAFVNEDIAYFLAVLAAGDPTAISKARVAMRDPDGPWRHGSVYLYVLERNTNTIMFHGAFPNRYEQRPLVPIARDAITGKLVLPQVIEAAESNLEGAAFLEYHFDSPEDPSDSDETPKVGFANEFAFRSVELLEQLGLERVDARPSFREPLEDQALGEVEQLLRVSHPDSLPDFAGKVIVAM